MDSSFILLSDSGGKDREVEGIANGEVVETDLGYYWLTCSFDNDGEEGGGESEVEDLTCVQDDGNESCDHCIEGVGEYEAAQDDLNCPTDEWLARYSRQRNFKCNSDIIVRRNQDSYVLLMADGKSPTMEMKSSLSQSLPNFLSLGKFKFWRHGSTREGNKGKSSENLSLKRREMSPGREIFGKVSKVVSVDLPKLDLSDLGTNCADAGLATRGQHKVLKVVNTSTDKNDENERPKSGEVTSMNSVGAGNRMKVSKSMREYFKKGNKSNSKRKSAEEIISTFEQKRNKDFKFKPKERRRGNKDVFTDKKKSRSCDAMLLSEDLGLENLAEVIECKKRHSMNENVSHVCKNGKSGHGMAGNVEMEEMFIEPPVMFKDVPVAMTTEMDLTDGYILEPPPAFASEPSDKTTDTTDAEMSSERPLVWDPGVHSGEATLEKKHKHPITPPPPSLDRTERLISSIMNEHKHRKYSGDANSGLDIPDDPWVPRKNSVDTGYEGGYQSGYSEVPCVHLSSDSGLSDSGSNRKYKLVEEPGTIKTPKMKPRVRMGTKTVTKPVDMNGNIASNKRKDEITELLDSYQSGSKGDYAEIDDINDQCVGLNSYNKCDSVSKRGTDTVDAAQRREPVNGFKTVSNGIDEDLDQLYATVNKQHSGGAKVDNHIEDDDDNIYAVVDKKNRMNQSEKKSKQNTLEKSKLPPEPPEEPPPLPPKPKNLHLLLSDSAGAGKVPNDTDTAESESVKPRAAASDSDTCTDFQVMLNSLSPVLLRRRPSCKMRKKSGSSSDTSPDATPEVSPRVEKQNTADSNLTLASETASESLFMDPEMSRTWHGNTGTDWSNIYGPQLRAMMQELNDLTNTNNQTSSDVNLQAPKVDHHEYHSKTMPTKSLLDQMHKKVCADQYWNNHDAEMARALVLFRLKSPPPVKPKRSQSFHIRMGTGTSSLSGGSSMSPMLPRAAERIYIKTRPDVQFSSKSGKLRPRATTPETFGTSMPAQNPRKEDAEIEAIEACRWLRETGFPQYAQLYEDGQFPVDIESVEKDHDFLDKEDIQSLFRRLNTLNKCAIMKIGTSSKKDTEESDEEDQCALSDKWKYQRSSRRWSRKDLDTPMIENHNGEPVLKSASSHDSLLADQNSSSEPGDSPVLDSKKRHQDKMTVDPLDANGNTTIGVSPPVFRRSASDRIKGAKSFLKRMESLKSKRSRKQKTITEISEPVISNKADMNAKIRHLNCRDISGPIHVDKNVSINTIEEVPDLTGSQHSELTVREPGDKVSGTKDGSDENVFLPDKSLDQRVPGIASGNSSTVSDAEASLTNGALGLDLTVHSPTDSGSNTTTSSLDESIFLPVEYRPGRFPKCLDDSLFNKHSDKSDTNRHRSFSVANDSSLLDSKASRRGSHDPRNAAHRVSIYDNVPIEEDLAEAQQELDIILSELFQNINGFNKAINGDDAEPLEPPSSILDDTSFSADSQPNDTPNDGQSDVTHEEVEENEVLSGTLSSPDISDHELHIEDMSHDDSVEHIGCRERRDSGVGSSLTRSNSDRRKYRIRWHSFQKSHRPNSDSRNLQLCNLSAGQLLVLKKLSLLKLTALLEKYSPGRSGWSLSMPRNLFKRNKVPDYRSKNVFGVPFTVIIQRSGQALPQCILHAMRFLRRTAEDALGIFRKSGVRSRIQKLRNEIEANPESVNFDELQAYDVADLVKQYFRELPECLLTNKLSDIFISIFIYVPLEMRLEALQAAVVLMADENRDVLQSLLLFLSDIAKQHTSHQMTASNLAVCFAPSLFNMGGTKNPSQTPSPRRNRKNPGIPDARELMEQKAAHECLTVMINECKKLFTMSAATLSKCRVWHGDPVSLEELNSAATDGGQGYTAYIEACIQGLLKEARDKFRGWVSEKMPADCDIDVSNKKVGDGHPLRLWKCSVDVEAPPSEVLNRVLNDRQMWDEDLLQWNTVEKLDKQTEVFQYVRNSMAPHPTRDFCVLRSWRTDLPKGTCVLISTSIEHPKAELHGGLRAVELASRYLIEPCGTGKSRLTHISRVDIRGHSPDWYKKVYGYLCAGFMERIRASFQCQTDGPETKV